MNVSFTKGHRVMSSREVKYNEDGKITTGVTWFRAVQNV